VKFARRVARARVTIDARPPGPVGTITIESMLLGVPVVVPDDSASRAHVAAANGGLWYRDVGELFDAVRVLVHSPIGAKLAQQGRSYALAKHGDIDDFVARTATLVLGGDRARTPAQV
jgi:glycosyltransferase involved in cell wall biosynthesis